MPSTAPPAPPAPPAAPPVPPGGGVWTYDPATGKLTRAAPAPAADTAGALDPAQQEE